MNNPAMFSLVEKLDKVINDPTGIYPEEEVLVALAALLERQKQTTNSDEDAEILDVRINQLNKLANIWFKQADRMMDAILEEWEEGEEWKRGEKDED